jgi:translation initiation factor 2 alpha subunit (eIF-2alpha)
VNKRSDNKVTTKEMSEKLREAKRYEKQLKTLNTILDAVKSLNKQQSQSLSFVLKNMGDNFDDSFQVALENEINRTEINLETWSN